MTTDLPAYAAAVASDAPTPGGGSVAGTVAALAAALAEMVCNLSLKKAGPNDARLRQLRDQATTLRTRCLALAADDETVFGAYRAAAALPRRTDAERSERQAAMQTALRQAAEIPLALATTCTRLLDLLPAIFELASRHVLADAEVSTLLADAALRSALVNVRVNARLMRSPEQAQHFLTTADALETKARQQTATLLAAVAG